MATVYWRGRSAYLNWRDERGQHRQSLGAIPPRQAEKIRSAKEYELTTGQRVLVDLGVPLFRDFAVEYLKWYEAEHPDTAYNCRLVVEQALVPEFGYTALDQIRPAQVEQAKAKWRQPVQRKKRIIRPKPSTVNKRLRTLKAMLSRAVEWEVIRSSPIKAVKPAKSEKSAPPTFYSTEQLRLLYQVSPRAAIWKLMANTGLRRGEALHLRREHVLRDRIRVLSEEGARTKSGKWREVPLTEAALSALAELGQEGYVLPRVQPESLSRHFAKDAKKAGLPGNLHCLRHTFGSHCVMKGVPIRTLQILMGHSKSTTTEIYAHHSKEYLAGALAGLEL